MEDVRSRLADLAGLSARQAADDDEIANAAVERIRVINGELDDLGPRVSVSKTAATQYQDLVKERGLLNQTLARLGR